MDECADRLANYSVRRFLPPGSADFVDRMKTACNAFDGRGGLFAQSSVSETLGASETDSLAAQQVARAYAATRDAHGDSRTFLEKIAEDVCDATRAIAHVQKNYKDDAECHEALDQVTPAAKARVADVQSYHARELKRRLEALDPWSALVKYQPTLRTSVVDSQTPTAHLGYETMQLLHRHTTEVVAFEQVQRAH